MTNKKGGRPTKYCKEIAEKLAQELSHRPLREACKIAGIDAETYYTWLYKYPEFLELSTVSRKAKAIKHFTECENILEEVAKNPNDPTVRSDIMRLRLDFHLRLAGKANQGLFGDKVQVNDEREREPVVMNVNLSKE